jgi:hypothetical protein
VKRKIILIAVFVVFGLSAAGYGTAYFSRKIVENELRREITAKNVRGLGLLGEKIPHEKIEVHAEVKYPFVVEGYYFVPIDLHGRYRFVEYLALPWGIYHLSTQDFYPI